MDLNLTAVCVSWFGDNTLDIDIPFHNEVNFDRTAARGTVERAQFVAHQRNVAMDRALRKYKDTTHVLMIDSYYIDQVDAVKLLISDYQEFARPTDILGASTWIKTRTDTLRPRIRFYDIGTTPEAKDFRHGDSLGIIRVKAVGACYILPVSAWYQNGYLAPDPVKFEPEHMWLCKGFDCWLDLDVKLYRPDRQYDDEVMYPLGKALRVTLGRWRRKLVQ